MTKVSVVLDEKQQTELQMILIDRDKEEAIRFLKEVVWAQVEAIRRHGMCGPVDAA